MKSYLILIGTLVLMVLTLLFATHRYILSNYHAIETAQNERIVKTLLQSIQAQTNFMKKTLADYAEWDDTFSFMQTGAPEYIYANFRENSYTLENLGVCLIAFFDTERAMRLHVASSSISSSQEMLEKIAQYHQEAPSGFVLKDGVIYFYDEHPINNSDASETSNGWLMGVGRLDIGMLQEQNPEFLQILLESSFEVDQLPKRYGMGGRGVDVLTHWHGDGVENWVIVGRRSNGEAYGLRTTHGREMLAQGKGALNLFLLVVGGMAAMIFFLLMLRQKEAKREKATLEETVAQRTKELKGTMEELEKAVKKLERLAYVDELTGVQTRRSFFEAIHPLLYRAAKERKTVCVALIDLDDFKLINDNYGHAAGDLVLQHFCNSCREFLDERMLFARIGGEEFVISFYDISLRKAEEICLNIQHHVGENPVIVDAHTHVAYTFSLGIADNSASGNIDELLREADARMYCAKSLGKNSIRSRN